MLDEKLRDKVLVDELQLGNRLNESVASGDRADFQLLLSMLSADVCDAPQFNRKLSQKEPENLRERFALGKEQRFYADKQDFSKGIIQSQLLHDRGSLCEYERKLAPEVYADLSALERQKFIHLNDESEPSLSEIAQSDGFEILQEAELLHPASVSA